MIGRFFSKKISSSCWESFFLDKRLTSVLENDPGWATSPAQYLGLHTDCIFFHYFTFLPLFKEIQQSNLHQRVGSDFYGFFSATGLGAWRPCLQSPLYFFAAGGCFDICNFLFVHSEKTSLQDIASFLCTCQVFPIKRFHGFAAL